ncbi:hypothetical protein Y032_0229g2899 [Ancylostoma ceylanicum]|uniref:Uncharacterized protein n=1 Tax=Ancylostoma ceylanicum TaxID=53326 RepID=A0A016SGB0_9BILA|nr:hypothetical protein Y032_0229g2899 [Ancylostoma ceylanicum]
MYYVIDAVRIKKVGVTCEQNAPIRVAWTGWKCRVLYWKDGTFLWYLYGDMADNMYDHVDVCVSKSLKGCSSIVRFLPSGPRQRLETSKEKKSNGRKLRKLVEEFCATGPRIRARRPRCAPKDHSY